MIKIFYRKHIKNKINLIIIFVTVFFVVAPVVINEGLRVADLYYSITGKVITAKGLTVENWLDFWRDYVSSAIVYFGILLVWISSEKDREKEKYKERADDFLEKLNEEKEVFVEVIKCFDTGVLVKAIIGLNENTLNESKILIQEEKDKINEVHIKFEMLTSISYYFEKNEKCMKNPCIDVKMKINIRDLFFEMEKLYWDVLDRGEEFLNIYFRYINNQSLYNVKKDTIEMIKVNMNDMKKKIFFDEKAKVVCKSKIIEYKNRIEKEKSFLKELENEQQLLKVKIDKLTNELVNKTGEISNTMKPKFIRYCKDYIDLQEKHAVELRETGLITCLREEDKSPK